MAGMLRDGKEFAQPMSDAAKDRIVRRVVVARGYNYKFHTVPQQNHLCKMPEMRTVPGWQVDLAACVALGAPGVIQPFVEYAEAGSGVVPPGRHRWHDRPASDRGSPDRH